MAELSCADTEDCVKLQQQTDFRPGNEARDYTSLKQMAEYLNSFLKKTWFAQTDKYEQTSTGVFVVFILFSFGCIMYVLGSDSKPDSTVAVPMNQWPILSALFMFATIWFYFFVEIGDREKPDVVNSPYMKMKEWSKQTYENVIMTMQLNIHKTYKYDVTIEKGDKFEENHAYSFLTNINYLYIFFIAKTVVITSAVLCYIYYCYNGTVLASLGAFFLMLIYLAYITDFYAMLDTFAEKQNPATKKENNEFIFSQLNPFFIGTNIVCIVVTICLFVSRLFPQCEKAGWIDMTVAVLFVGIMFTVAEGKTMGEKYKYIMTETKNYWIYLPTLTAYVLFMVSFLVMKQPTPQFITSIVSSMKNSEKRLVDNIYIYGIFPLMMYAGYKLFYLATYAELDLPLAVDYNIIRIRYCLIYFLMVVFVCTIIFNKSNVPCYVQRIVSMNNTFNKGLIVCIAGMLICGLIFTISVITSPYEFTMKTNTKTTAPVLESKTNNILMPIRPMSVMRIFVCVSLIIVILVIRSFSASTSIFTTAKFLVFVVIMTCLFLILLISEFLNTESSHGDSKLGNIMHIVRNFCMFASGGAFFIFVVSFLYCELINKAPDNNLVYLQFFIFILYVIYKILISMNVLQNNNTTFRYVVETIFIIPCLFETYVLPKMVGEAAYKQYMQLRYNTWYMYAFVAILIVILLVWRKYITPHISTSNQLNALGGYLLLNGPNNTNVQVPGNINNINVLMQEFIAPQVYNDNSNNAGILTTYLYNYSLGFWFYIENTQNSDGTLLDLASNPIVEYHNDNNTLKITFNISSTNETKEAILQDIKIQKWNFVMINVDNGFSDIFLNGTLSATIQDFIPYFNSASPSITIGEKDGVFGQICNFNFYPRPLSILEITSMHSWLQNANPPTTAYQTGETKFANSKYEDYLRKTEMQANDLKNDFICAYQPIFESDASNEPQLTPAGPTGFISLKWVFEQMGDKTNGL